MTPERFGRALDRGRLRALAGTASLAAAYARVIRSAANRAARTLTSDASLTAAADPGDWQPPAEGTLLGQVGVSVAIRRKQLQAVERTARPALEQTGIAWDVHDPLMRELLAQTEAWSGRAVEQAMLPELRRIVAQAFADGLSVKDAAALIRATFAETSVWQAEMLARSNLNMIGNGGMDVAVKRYNQAARSKRERTIETKTWTTAGDSAVRATHVAASGQTVPVDQSFQVGGSLLAFPGDPGGALGEVLNCRCVALYGSRAPTAGVASAAVAAVRQRERRRLRDGALTAATIASVGWVSDLAFEGEATSDGRYMLPGSISWRDLPLTLMAQTVTDDGHDGAFVAGRIDKINRSSSDIDGQPLPDGTKSVRGSGAFDMGGENGAEIARLVADETLRGVSVDLGVLDWAFRDPDTGEIIEPADLTEAQMERAFWGELQYAVRKAELMAATVCPTPAFANAKIAVTASGRPVVRLAGTFELDTRDAVLVAAAAPVAPPRDWFFTGEPDGPVPLTITDTGHVYGHIAAWGACHVGKPGQCFQPPSSPSGYAYFNLTEILCGDGSTVTCGQVTIGTDHAPLAASWREVKAHYEQTGRCIADVRASDGKHGIWVAGALRPHVTDEERREIMGAKPSGDWRQITPGGPLELVGTLQVNHPGFPVPRPQLALAASAASPDGEPVALIAAGILGDEAFDRRLQVLEARMGGAGALAALIG